MAMLKSTPRHAAGWRATVTAVRGDSTCIDAGAGTAAAERLITAEGVNGSWARLLGRDRRDAAERRRPERHRDDLALGHLAGAVDRRR
jgi:hypothetical protein